MPIHYSEHEIDEVLYYFAKEFKPTGSEEVLKVEWFIDPVKKVIVYKIITKSL